jgi:ABC-type molybdate transport system substrate-binding protein
MSHPGEPTGLAKEFLDLVLSPEGQKNFEEKRALYKS